MQGNKQDPRAPLGGNFRPTQPLNARNIRTNVMVRPERVSLIEGEPSESAVVVVVVVTAVIAVC